MATEGKKRKGTLRKRFKTPSETEDRAPAGRGGAAMGRTVGLPFGGGRPRKHRASTAKSKHR